MNFEELAFLFKCDISNRGICRLDFDEAACLYGAIKHLNPHTVVEIGRASGGSTLLIACAMDVGSMLISLDVVPINNKEIEYFLTQQDAHVKLVVCNSKQYQWSGSEIDLLFIDGDHSYEGAKYDFDYYGQFVRKGGYIIFHDMGKARPSARNDHRLIQLRGEIIESKEYITSAQAGSLIVFEKT